MNELLPDQTPAQSGINKIFGELNANELRDLITESCPQLVSFFGVDKALGQLLDEEMVKDNYDTQPDGLTRSDRMKSKIQQCDDDVDAIVRSKRRRKI